MNYYYQHKKELDRVLISVVAIFFIYIFVTYMYTYFVPFIIAFILSMAIEPSIEILTKRFKIGRGIAILFSMIFTMLVIAIIIRFIVYVGIEQGAVFFKKSDIYIQEIQIFINEINITIHKFLAVNMLDIPIDKMIESAIKMITNSMISISRRAVTSVPLFFTNTMIVLIATFFFSKDKENIKTSIKIKTPYFQNNIFRNIRNGLSESLFSYIKAQSVLMVIAFFISLVGTLIIEPSYAIFISLGIALVDFLPLFGSGLFLWPWAIFQLLSGDVQKAVFIMILYLTITLVRQMLEPRILGKQIGLHPIITIMSMYIGMRVFGLFGFFIGPVIAIIIRIINKDEKV
jgi:sporulation integral membrane protein YtvI